jgi:hypothetical protein
MIGALVSQYSITRNSPNADRFDVRIIHTDDHPFLGAREGQEYLRGGRTRPWLMEDLQSFTPLRFMPPELMGYAGRAIVIDPDVFAVGDVFELLSREMAGTALMCRARKGPKGLASSVMLLDCAKLRHWRCAEQFDEMFASRRDYMDWISLKLEPQGTIGLLEPEWNDFDHLTPETRLLHNTKRWNQPWKTGLPVGFTPAANTPLSRALSWVRQVPQTLFGRYAMLGHYRAHWDPNQERFFFGLLRECLDKGVVSEQMLRAEIAAQPRPPRRPRGDRAHAAARRLSRSPPSTPGIPVEGVAHACVRRLRVACCACRAWHPSK